MYLLNRMQTFCRQVKIGVKISKFRDSVKNDRKSSKVSQANYFSATFSRPVPNMKDWHNEVSISPCHQLVLEICHGTLRLKVSS